MHVAILWHVAWLTSRICGKERKRVRKKEGEAERGGRVTVGALASSRATSLLQQLLLLLRLLLLPFCHILLLRGLHETKQEQKKAEEDGGNHT